MNTILKMILQIRGKKYIPKNLKESDDYIELVSMEFMGDSKYFIYMWFVDDDYLYKQIKLYRKENKKSKPNQSERIAFNIVDYVRDYWGENAVPYKGISQEEYGRSLILVRVDVNQTRYRVVG